MQIENPESISKKSICQTEQEANQAAKRLFSKYSDDGISISK